MNKMKRAWLLMISLMLLIAAFPAIGETASPLPPMTWDTYDPALEEVTAAQKIEMARERERLALAGDGRVTLLCTVQGSQKRLLPGLMHLDGYRDARLQAETEEGVTLLMTFEAVAMPEKQVFTLCSAMGAPILHLSRVEDDLEQVFLKAISG